MKKRGETSGNVFIYALSIIVVALILIFGYKSISSVISNKADVELVSLKAEMQKDAEVTSKSFGSMKKVSYAVPSPVSEVCFVDLAKVDPLTITNSALIKESAETKAQQNVFFVAEDRFEAFYVPGLSVQRYPYYTCLEPSSGTVTFTIRGEMNRGVSIIAPPPRRYCENAQTENLCGALDGVFGNGYRTDCCSTYGLCC